MAPRTWLSLVAVTAVLSAQGWARNPAAAEQSGTAASAPSAAPSQPALAPPSPAPPAKKTFTVPAGTKVLLQLRSAVNTKSARPGDGVYLASIFPVVVGSRVMIPAGV